MNTKNILKASIAVALLLGSAACSDKKKEDKPADTSAATSNTPAKETTATPDKAEKEKPAGDTSAKEDAPAEDAPGEDDIPSEVEEATAVTPVKHDKKLPEGFEMDGEVAAVIGWTDKYGNNAVVFTLQDQKGKGEEGSGKLMLARHALQEGDGSWTEVRSFKELVDDCPFDIALEVFTGDWSVTDLDKDLLGEATFAYKAGCRSDVSPVAHKVLMTENGKKWALRGQTRIKEAGGSFGGDFKPDFKDGPAGGLEHAKVVWEKTVTESF